MIKSKANKLKAAISCGILMLMAGCASQIKAPIEGLGPDGSYGNDGATVQTSALTPTQDLTSSDIGQIYNAAQYTPEQQQMMMKALSEFSCKTINFAFDSTRLTDETEACLQKVADYLLQYQQPIRLAGHTDPTGSEKYNLNLGRRRANSVRDYLLQQGVGASQICTVSYGSSKPVIQVNLEQIKAQVQETYPEKDWGTRFKIERNRAYYQDRRVELGFGQQCL